MMTHSERESKIPLSMDEFADSCEIESIAMDNLGVYLSLLEKWQRRFNLVGPKTLDDPWRRHFLDSAQLIPFIKSMQGPVIDMGTGAGFPGLVLSILGTPDVHLIESDANKTEFLRQVIRETKATATIHRVRMEDYDGPKATCLTSRACASLGALLDYGQRISKPGARALFLKGKTCPDELTTAQGLWHIEHTCHPSQSDPNGIVLEIHEFTRR